MIPISRNSKLFAILIGIFLTLLIAGAFLLLQKSPAASPSKTSIFVPATITNDSRAALLKLDTAYEIQSHGITAGCFPREQIEKILSSAGESLSKQLDAMGSDVFPSAEGRDYYDTYYRNNFCLERVEQADQSSGYIVAFLINNKKELEPRDIAVWHNLNDIAHKGVIQIKQTPENAWKDRSDLDTWAMHPSILPNSLRIKKFWDAKKKNWNIQVLFQEAVVTLVSDIRTFSLDLETESVKQIYACLDQKDSPESLKKPSPPCRSIDEF